MKVKDLIEKLKELEQDKDIWIVYDSYLSYEPDFEVATFCVDDCKTGDYIMEVG